MWTDNYEIHMRKYYPYSGTFYFLYKPGRGINTRYTPHLHLNMIQPKTFIPSSQLYIDVTPHPAYSDRVSFTIPT